MASLPEYARSDMETGTLVALKRGRGLHFFLLPSKGRSEAPWIIVDKGGKARERFREARKAIRGSRPKHFDLQKSMSGRVEKRARRLYFVLDDDAPFAKLPQLLARIWPTKLRNEDGLKKMASLLRNAIVLTEQELARLDVEAYDADIDGDSSHVDGSEEEASTPVSPSSEIELPGLTEDELDEFFGDDADDVQASMRSLATLANQLPTSGAPVEEEQATRLIREVLVSGPVSPLDDPTTLSTGLARLLTAPDPRTTIGFSEGGELPLRDQVLQYLSDYTRFQDELDRWERQIEMAETLSDAAEDATEDGDVSTREVEELTQRQQHAITSSQRMGEQVDRHHANLTAKLSSMKSRAQHS